MTLFPGLEQISRAISSLGVYEVGWDPLEKVGNLPFGHLLQRCCFRQLLLRSAYDLCLNLLEILQKVKISNDACHLPLARTLGLGRAGSALKRGETYHELGLDWPRATQKAQYPLAREYTLSDTKSLYMI